MVQIPTSAAPKDFICPITNEIMEDPVYDPIFDAVSFERKAILRRLREEGKPYCPVSGYPLAVESLVSNTKLQWMIRFWLKQQEKKQQEAAATAAAAVASSDEDTATTTATTDNTVASDTTPIKDVPKHLICPLSGNLMKDPVTTKYGHHFEKQNLVNWLCKNGNVCPLTYQPLEMRQVVSNVNLQMELRQINLDHHQGEEEDLTVVKLQEEPSMTIDKVTRDQKIGTCHKMNVFKGALQTFKIRNGTTLSSNPIAGTTGRVVDESEEDVMSRVATTLDDVEKLLLIAD